MKSDRGAILVMMAVALIGLMAFSAFVVDYGVLWTARGQAQTTVDAAALSGAVSRIVDDTTNPPASKVSGPIYRAVVNTAAANLVWGQAPPAASLDLNWTCPISGTTNCVVVDLWRDGNHGSTALPVMFAQLFGVTSQGVRAHAVAETLAANAASCMRPWFLLDKYTDVNNNGTFESPPDLYANPGYTANLIGTTITFHDNVSPSGYGQIDVDNGGKGIKDAIKYCVDNATYAIGQVIPAKPGGTVGPEKQGVDDVMGWDPYATWNNTTKAVEGSCAPGGCNCGLGITCPNGGAISPRIFVVPICSPTQLACAQGGPSNSTVTITNFLSFLLMGRSGHGNDMDIEAILIGAAGSFVPNAPTSPAPFLKIVRLIR